MKEGDRVKWINDTVPAWGGHCESNSLVGCVGTITSLQHGCGDPNWVVVRPDGANVVVGAKREWLTPIESSGSTENA